MESNNQDGSKLTPEEILNKHLRTSDDIWEVADLKNAMEEYAAQYNRAHNESLEKLIRERDRFSEQTAALQARLNELEGWKREAVHVIQGLNMQELGKEIGVPLGKEISPEMLPAVKQLKSRITELEEGNTKLHLKCIKDKTESYKQIHEAKQRAEKLMGLLEDAIKGQSRMTYDGFILDSELDNVSESDWQSYRKEHGLTAS